MKHLKVLFIIIMIFIMSLHTPVSSSKIQLKDNWQYRDRENRVFNETAEDIVQFVDEKTSNAIATTKVKSNRYMDFPYQENYTIQDGYFIMDIKPNRSTGFVYITQEGGIPLFSTRNMSGQIYSYNYNSGLKYNYTFTDKIIKWEILGGDPSKSIQTTGSIVYTIRAIFSEYGNTQEDVYLDRTFVISTNQDIVETKRNYTISLSRTYLRMENQTDLEVYDSDWNYYKLNNIKDTYLITWDQNSKLPIYIATTEPVAIVKNSLGLDQLDQNIIEYFLVQEDDTTQTTTNPSSSSSKFPTNSDLSDTPFFLFSSLLLLIPIVISKKHKL